MPLALILHALIKQRISYFIILGFAFISFNFLIDNEPKIGNQCPDFSGKLYDGKDFKISSLKGSYTLIQFWASWDLPSLTNNMDLTATYLKYKDTKFIDGKKFNIVSISIDQKSETYHVVIKREAYPWPYFICDFKGWKSSLIDSFHVELIPTNYLLNPKGVIIAKNLYNNNLETELKKYLNK
jgi:hypothetical protein